MGGLGNAPPPELTVVLPAYNEAARLEASLASIRLYLDSFEGSTELIVVDDGSTDGTADLAHRLLDGSPDARVLQLAENCGKGAAVRAGMLAAHGRHVLFSDVDLSTPIRDEAGLRAALAAGADVAIGSRAEANSQITRRQNIVRESMGRIFNLFVRLLRLSDIHDTQCGFKMLTLDAARKIFPRTRVQGFAFDVEVLFLARMLGLRIDVVPVEWKNHPASRVQMIRDSVRMILTLIRIRWLYRSGM